MGLLQPALGMGSGAGGSGSGICSGFGRMVWGWSRRRQYLGRIRGWSGMVPAGAARCVRSGVRSQPGIRHPNQPDEHYDHQQCPDHERVQHISADRFDSSHELREPEGPECGICGPENGTRDSAACATGRTSHRSVASGCDSNRGSRPEDRAAAGGIAWQGGDRASCPSPGSSAQPARSSEGSTAASARAVCATAGPAGEGPGTPGDDSAAASTGAVDAGYRRGGASSSSCRDASANRHTESDQRTAATRANGATAGTTSARTTASGTTASATRGDATTSAAGNTTHPSQSQCEADAAGGPAGNAGAEPDVRASVSAAWTGTGDA